MEQSYCFEPRILRSPWADYNGNDISSSRKAHPDNYLSSISKDGFNGVWLKARLRDIVPSSAFKEFGSNSNIQLKNLAKLVERAAKYSVKVYIYFCEPLGFRAEDPFWKKYPKVQGHPTRLVGAGPEDGLYYSMCTSTNQVKTFLEESTYRLFKSVPGLGGVFFTTASEYPNNCYSHYIKPGAYDDPNFEEWSRHPFGCPRCQKRTSADVVAEIITLINRGVKTAAHDSHVIAWSWSWEIIEPAPQKELISKLPKDVFLMSDWERGGRKKIAGRFYKMDEYSFSYTGPSPRFRKQLHIAQNAGLQCLSRFQANTTHEIAAVPYIPVPFLIAKKLVRMRQMGIKGYIASWVFGGESSHLTSTLGKLSRSETISVKQAITKTAMEQFGGNAYREVVSAWRLFSEAWKQFPFSTSFIYYGPVNYAVAYPMNPASKPDQVLVPSWRALPRNIEGQLLLPNNIEIWTRQFTARQLVSSFTKLVSQWSKGVEKLGAAVKFTQPNEALVKEYSLARYILISIQSSINLINFYSQNSGKCTKDLLKIMSDELKLVDEAIGITKAYPDMNWHPEAYQNMFTVDDLKSKRKALLRNIRKPNR